MKTDLQWSLMPYFHKQAHQAIGSKPDKQQWCSGCCCLAYYLPICISNSINWLWDILLLQTLVFFNLFQLSSLNFLLKNLFLVLSWSEGTRITFACSVQCYTFVSPRLGHWRWFGAPSEACHARRYSASFPKVYSAKDTVKYKLHFHCTVYYCNCVESLSFTAEHINVLFMAPLKILKLLATCIALL